MLQVYEGLIMAEEHERQVQEIVRRGRLLREARMARGGASDRGSWHLPSLSSFVQGFHNVSCTLHLTTSCS